MTIREKLYTKLELEYDSFIENLKTLPPEEIIQAAYEKVSKEEILLYIKGMEHLSYEQAEEMLNNHTLSNLYHHWLGCDGGIGEALYDTISNYVDEIDTSIMYKAEIEMPNMEYPHFEIFHADNDIEAVKKARELCDTENGHILLEVHEIDEDYNIIREVDLVNHDPSLRRFMDVNLIDFLGQIADKTIIYYPDDWKSVATALQRIAELDSLDYQRLMLQVSGYGTHFFHERDTFIKETPAHNYRTRYRENEPTMQGFVIEVSGISDGAVIGNVYNVGDYSAHAKYVMETALELGNISLTYSDRYGENAGKTITVSYDEYDGNRNYYMSKCGEVLSIKPHPIETNQTMADLLDKEQAKRNRLPIGDPKEFLQDLDKKLAEIRSIPKFDQNLEQNPAIPEKSSKLKSFDQLLQDAQAKADKFNSEKNQGKEKPQPNKNNPDIGE